MEGSLLKEGKSSSAREIAIALGILRYCWQNEEQATE